MSAVETELIRLAPIAVKGAPDPIEVRVSTGGVFSAELNGDEYASEDLSTLRRQLTESIKVARVSIPFASRSGRRGIIRGWHAGRNVVLVTWADGTKGDIKSYEDVFLPGEISETEIARLAYIETQIRQLATEREAIFSGAKHRPEHLIAEKLGLVVDPQARNSILRNGLAE